MKRSTFNVGSVSSLGTSLFGEEVVNLAMMIFQLRLSVTFEAVETQEGISDALKENTSVVSFARVG